MINKVFRLDKNEKTIVEFLGLAWLFADAVTVFNSVTYHNDLFLDFHSMREHMDEGVKYVWSLRKTGTFLVETEDYFGMYEECDYEYQYRFFVVRTRHKYEFTRID